MRPRSPSADAGTSDTIVGFPDRGAISAVATDVKIPVRINKRKAILFNMVGLANG
jgi:hypothetical protein